MELFDKRFVHFMWDDELEGKKCFVANGIDILINAVNKEILNTAIISRSKGGGNAIHSNETGNDYYFAYYDPNYEWRKAYIEGKKLQTLNGNVWEDITTDDVLEAVFAGGHSLRFKPEDEKWIVYLARYPDRPNLCCRAENYWENAKKFDGAKTKLFVGTEDECANWCLSHQKFAEVIKAWEDGKTIQCRKPSNRHIGWIGTPNPNWDIDLEYRVKPEETTVIAKRCSGCVHVHCSATKEPCVSCKPGNSKYEERLCKTCEHFDCEVDVEPCDSCIDEIGYPNWEPKKKEDKKWRPYLDTAEMVMDFKDRFNAISVPFCEPMVWVRLKVDKRRRLVVAYGDDFVEIGNKAKAVALQHLFEQYEFLDGSPCGMEVKE